MPEQTVERSGSLVETHKGYDPRLIAFYFFVAALLLTLVGGMAYQQLFRADMYHEREKLQNQRRILMPGPRGNIYDRNGRLLVGNRARFSVTLYLDELRKDVYHEYLRVRRNYRELGDKDIPGDWQLKKIARYSIVQKYLDQVNQALGRNEQVDPRGLDQHFSRSILLPYVLIDDLSPEEYAKLVEQLPVQSPLEVHATSARYYPYKSAAAHTLGYVSMKEELEVDKDFPGKDLKTFEMPGSEGKTGLEKSFDAVLQGKTGGSIYRVDPAGFRIEPPITKHLPLQGRDLVTSLDIDLQQVAEAALLKTELNSAAVLMDVSTGEILALASKPDFDLNDTSPRLKTAAAQKIQEEGAWLNRATQGIYPPGSSFKILVTIAGMRRGTIQPDSTIDCPGFYMVGKTSFPCHDRHAHGHIDLGVAIAKSCNVFFYAHGIETGPDAIATEARRFGFGQRTGIDLPFETGASHVPDPAWKKRRFEESWTDGDTANVSIGQGALVVTPLQMACFVASLARGETMTHPYLIHEANRPRQHTEKIGLTPEQFQGLVGGMELCTTQGTGQRITKNPEGPIQGLRVAGKTGTAQKRTKDGTINFAWFICFAPVENPKVAMAIVAEGDTVGEETGGGVYSVPVAYDVLKAWWAKENKPVPAKVAANP